MCLEFSPSIALSPLYVEGYIVVLPVSRSRTSTVFGFVRIPFKYAYLLESSFTASGFCSTDLFCRMSDVVIIPLSI